MARPTRDDLMRAAAERDGGWACRYCGVDLVPVRAVPLTSQVVMRARSTVGGGCGCGAGLLLPDGNRRCTGCMHSTDRVIDSVDRFEDGPGEIPNREHLTPVARGGDNSLDNCGLSCGPCNFQKGTKTEAEYLAWLDERALV